jgi:uncharacterized protein YecE (DUF72 family)
MIRVGVAGWDYPDWAGIVYPSPLPRGFDRLAFLAGLFDVVEINVTFYRQPEARAARSWARRVAGRRSFRFTAKLYNVMTHAGRLPGQGPPAPFGDLDLKDLRAEADRYREGIEPLLREGLLGAVLMQFPQSFHDLPASRRRLETLAGVLRGLPLVAEVRHVSWNHDDALRFLAGLGVGFCNVDQPRLGSTLGPTGHVTSPVAYVRLHGRNTENWFRPRDDADTPDGEPGGGARRYDYLYTLDELRPWVARIERLAERAGEVFVIANNHYRGKGAANALMLRSLAERRRVPAPADLVTAYPALAPRAEPAPAPPLQRRLF